MLAIEALCFLKVAEEKSFSRGAEQIHMSQPAVSKYILRMEQELNMPLLDRSTRHVALTEQGAILYEALRRSMDEWEAAVAAAQRVKSGEGQLKVGLLYGWSLHRLPTKAITEFQKAYPRAEVLIEKHTYCALTQRLCAGELDVIFTLKEELQESGPDIHYCSAFSDPLIMLLSRRHPAAAYGDPTPHLKGSTLFLMGNDASKCTISTIQPRLGREISVEARIKPSPNFESILLAVERCQGFTLTALSSSACEDPAFRYYRTGVNIEVVCAWNSRRSHPLAKAFARQFLRGEGKQALSGTMEPGR